MQRSLIVLALAVSVAFDRWRIWDLTGFEYGE